MAWLRLKMIVLSIAFVALIAGIVWIGSSNYSKAQKPSYDFGFVTSNADSVNIFAIKSPDFTEATEVLSVELPADSILVNIFPSPDQKWVVLEHRTRNVNERQFDLVNLETGDTRLIGQFAVQRFDIRYHSIEPDQLVHWAPDSQRFTVNIIVSNVYSTDIFLYDVIANTLTNLIQDQHIQYRVAWSDDSDTLAILTQKCLDDSCETLVRHGVIEVWRVATSTKLQEISLESLFPINVSPDLSICQLKWSPENRYLSFIGVCDPSLPAFKEVFVADIQKGTISQLTSNTAISREQLQYIFKSFYFTRWESQNELLVTSMVKQTFPRDDAPIPVYTTGIYNVEHESYTPITTAPLIVDIAKGTETNSTALRTSRINLEGEVLWQDLKVALDDFDNSTLNITMNLTAGCNLRWSPDGNILAIEVFEKPDILNESCQDFDHYAFYDTDRQQLITFDVGEHQAIFTLGWMNSEQMD